MVVALIYPHQLFKHHPAIVGSERVFIIEEPLLFGTDAQWPAKMHIKKLILHRASIRAYAKLIGTKAEVLELGGARSTDQQLLKLPKAVSEIRLCAVVDHVLDKRIRKYCEAKSIHLTELESPNFVTPSAWGHSYFNRQKKPFMASFYEAQRKRMGLLITSEGKPEGGKWSFDAENRFKLPKKVAIPKQAGIKECAEVRAARQDLLSEGVESWGDAEDFIYPVTHRAAEQWFEDFLQQRFASFGTYEDALSTRCAFLFHGVLTPMLNIGLLCPNNLIERAISYGKENAIEFNNIEGFVRQIIGWREFMKLMYERHGSKMRSENFWKFSNSIPVGMYRGNTGLAPVDLAVERLKRFGYTHHIDRLMVLGNFFLLIRTDPKEVYKWFMEVYIDSYDWVMVPNVFGMSQFSDGGLLVTKPYISGSNYIRKMSDYPKGEWCRAWDALFWTFVDEYRDFFAKQYRMRMMLSHLNKMSSDVLAEHYRVAEQVRCCLATGQTWCGD